METKSFPVKEISIQGHEFLQMEAEAFVDFSSELSKYLKKMSKPKLQQSIKEYEYAKTYNRKRIRMKKEKKALEKMVVVVFGDVLRRKEKRKSIS